uniref:Centromere protein S n=1 Tax=Kryptolebias marmoratus TaxID=37003 RepID=A0A3Q3F2T4_KRYMA
RLKAAVHYTVGRLCQKVGEKQRREFSRQVVAAIAETTFRQCIFAKDLEAFAHAKRSTVSTEDVKLAARRSTALFQSVYIQNKSEELAQEKELKKKREQRHRGQQRLRTCHRKPGTS